MVWVNGDSVATHRVISFKAHSNLIPISLREGLNTIVYKIGQLKGRWALYREFRPIDAAKDLLTASSRNYYNDLPRSAILPAGQAHLLLRVKTRRDIHLDSIPQVRFWWTDLLGRKTYGPPQTYRGASYPASLSLPEAFPGRALLHVETRLPKTGEVLYREAIPIFWRPVARRLARRLTRDTSRHPIQLARQRAVREMFHLRGDTLQTYSTRMKAHALADLYRYTQDRANFYRYSGPQNLGYRSEIDSTVQPYRLMVPAALTGEASTKRSFEEPLPVLFLLPFARGRKESFWRGRGRSHARMQWHATLSTGAQVLSVMTYGRGKADFSGKATEEIPQILEQMKQYFPIDTTRIAIQTWSNHAARALQLMSIRHLPITHVSFISPILAGRVNISSELSTLKEEYPALQWSLWYPLEDKRVPVRIMRSWARQVQAAGFGEVHYTEMPYATHSRYLFSPAKMFYWELGGKEAGPSMSGSYLHGYNTDPTKALRHDR